MIYKPTKTAIAVAYGQNPVPILTAKGDGAEAAAIIAEAKKKGIYIAQDPYLVSLLSDLELNDEILKDHVTYTKLTLPTTQAW